MIEQLDIEQEGIGKIEIVQEIPHNLKQYLIPTAIPVSLAGGHAFSGLMQLFQTEGCHAWYSRFDMGLPATLLGRGDMAALELRIAWKRQIHGTWDKMPEASLPEYHFQLSFVPHILTRAEFGAALYETFDWHYELAYLAKKGYDYQLLERFMNEVQLKRPAHLTRYAHRCTPAMTSGIRAVLRNAFTLAGKADLLREVAGMLLREALEEVIKPELTASLTHSDIDRLYAVKALIVKESPRWRGIE